MNGHRGMYSDPAGEGKDQDPEAEPFKLRGSSSTENEGQLRRKRHEGCET